MQKVTNDQELLEHLRKFFKDDSDYQEHLDKIEAKQDFYELVEPGFFWRFPGEGEGLDEIFSVFDHGSEMLSRVREIYKACLGNDHYYFIANPSAITNQELEKLADRWYRTVIAMRDHCEGKYQSDFLDALKNNPPGFELIKGQGPKKDPVNVEIADGELYDLEHEFMYAMEDSESPFERFREALYQMTCTYTVVYFVFWPLYQAPTKIEDPYRIFIEFWKHGIRVIFDEDRNVLKFYAPNLVAGAAL